MGGMVLFRRERASLFFDFMFEVYRDALLSGKKYISIDDFDNFFRVKSESDPIVSKWGHFTFDQLSKGYRNILVESGLGHREKRNIVVNKAMIHPDVEDHIKLIRDKEFLQALLRSGYCQRYFYKIQKRRKGERNYCKAERTRH